MGLRQPGRQAAMAAGDFQRVLAMRPLSRSPHFTLHHAAAALSPGAARPLAANLGADFGSLRTKPSDLSTGLRSQGQTLVDESEIQPVVAGSDPGLGSVINADLNGRLSEQILQQAQRLGLVLPKRWARRSVTRNLIRRLARVSFAHHAKHLPAGDWVLRLRETIDPRQFSSASSLPLKRAMSQELQQLFSNATRKHSQPGGAGDRR